MIISPIDVIRFQTCPRRWALEREWKVIRRRPKSIFDSCLREAVVRLSAGANPESTRAEARAQLMTEAAEPGMLLPEGAEPYVIASDLCAMLDTVLTAVSRLTLLQLDPTHTIPLPDSDHSYRPLSLADESGCLHRWLTVDAWDDDAATRELHSWLTAADMAVCDAPLTLHVVVIGSRRNGRQQSPWCRAALQPIRNSFRFLVPPTIHDGFRNPKPCPEDWRRVWYADLADADPERWVDAMIKDQIMPRLLLHPAIAEFPPAVRRQTLQHLQALAEQMDRTARELRDAPAEQAPDQPGPPEPAMSLPMARSACDGMVPCPWARACYRTDAAYGIATLGGYRRRDATDPDGSLVRKPAQLRTTGSIASRGSATTAPDDGSRTASVVDVSS